MKTKPRYFVFPSYSSMYKLVRNNWYMYDEGEWCWCCSPVRITKYSGTWEKYECTKDEAFAELFLRKV